MPSIDDQNTQYNPMAPGDESQMPIKDGRLSGGGEATAAVDAIERPGGTDQTADDPPHDTDDGIDGGGGNHREGTSMPGIPLIMEIQGQPQQIAPAALQSDEYVHRSRGKSRLPADRPSLICETFSTGPTETAGR